MEFLINKLEWINIFIEAIKFQSITVEDVKNIRTLMKPENMEKLDLYNVYKQLRSYFKDKINLKKLEGTKIFPAINKIRKDEVIVDVLK